jgi:hypothetical protein
VHALTNKIVTAAGAPQSLSFSVQNISSLSAPDANVIRQEFVAQLQQRRFRIVPSSTVMAAAPPAASSDPAANVQVTLSEGVEGLVWVAEIRLANQTEDQRQIAIVSVSKSSAVSARAADDSLILAKKLIWEQPDAFLDFALLPSSSAGGSMLAILDPARLAVYRSTDPQPGGQFNIQSAGPADTPTSGQWQLFQSIAVANSNPRNMYGHIDAAARTIFLPNTECVVDFSQPQQQPLRCVPPASSVSEQLVEIPGHEDNASAELAARCDDATVSLGTGSGDWTQSDAIQGFERSNAQAEPVPAGLPIATDGPVISLWSPPGESDARAVIYNLKTNRYEGYVVTATCSH